MKHIPVLMLAFSDETDDFRLVDVPDEEVDGATLAEILERVFYWGQNDFQPKQKCSVSCGDVIQWDGENYLVCSIGFRKMTPDQMSEYKAIVRRDRPFYALECKPNV